MAIITKARMQQLRGKYNQLNKEALLPGEFAICDDHNPIVRTNVGYKELLTEDNAEYFENKVVEIDNAISSTNKAISDMEQATSDNTQRVDNAIQQIQTKIGIDDTQSSILTTYSSDKIDKLFEDINIEDISESRVDTIEEVEERTPISPKDKMKLIVGKIVKTFADIKNIAFSGSISDITDFDTVLSTSLLSTESGKRALDEAVGKILNDKIEEIKNLQGSTDISAIGDGTVTGAVSILNSNLFPTTRIINARFFFYSIGNAAVSNSVYVPNAYKYNYNIDYISITSGNELNASNFDCNTDVGSAGNGEYISLITWNNYNAVANKLVNCKITATLKS